MFPDIGERIKKKLVWMVASRIVDCVFLAIFLFIFSDEVDDDLGLIMKIVAVVVACFGCENIWRVAHLYTALGELVTSNAAIAANMEKLQTGLAETRWSMMMLKPETAEPDAGTSGQPTVPQIVGNHQIKCPKCGRVQLAENHVCLKCGERLY